MNDGQWGWRALRLLAKKSPHFFTYGNNPIARLPEYLETMLKKMSGANPSSAASNTSSASVASNGTTDKDGKEDEKPELVTEAQIEKLAENLGDKWKKLIPKLAFSKDDQAKFEAEGKSDKGETFHIFWVLSRIKKPCFYFRSSHFNAQKMGRSRGRRCSERRTAIHCRKSKAFQCVRRSFRIIRYILCISK